MLLTVASLRADGQRTLRSLSALGGAGGRVAAVPASQIVCGPQAARRMEELAGTGSVARGALGLKGSPSERMCQLAIRTLRATAALAGVGLPWRRVMAGWRLGPGGVGRPARW